MAEEKMNVHTVEPPENLHNISLSADKMVSDKWVNVNQQPSLIDENDRKTGEVSPQASEELKGSAYKPNM